MAISLRTNIDANTARLNGKRAIENLSAAAERVSSQQRINQFSDDPGESGAIAVHTMSNSIRTKGLSNLSDAAELVGRALEADAELSSLLDTMSTLAANAATYFVTTEQRSAISQEVSNLQTQFNSIIQNTSYGGRKLLNGETYTLDMTSGLEGTQNARINVGIQGLSTSGSSATLATLNLTTVANATSSYSTVAQTESALSSHYGSLSGNYRRLEQAVNAVSQSRIDTDVGIGRILEADVADEEASKTRHSILAERATSIEAQANLIPQRVLDLLK